MKRRFLIATALLLAACTGGGERPVVEHEGVRFMPLEAERLPDMPRPRTGHVVLPIGNGFMVAGGHTTGFVPVQEADFWFSGSWTTVAMLYPHDTPFALPLKDGRVVIGGGYAESFGIGQSWGVECYDPATRTFSPLPILDRKRAHASAVELSGNKLIISGNWWTGDDIERYVFEDYDRCTKPSAEVRSYPYVLRSEVDNALIFGSRDERYNPTGCVVDRWEGDSFEVPLFRQWQPYSLLNHGPIADEAFIGDMSTGHFSYLIHVKDSTERQSALVRLSGETFSLLETSHPIPSEGPWGPISYNGYVQTDRSAQTAWLLGVDAEKRVYLAGIDYGKALSGVVADVTMYYTDPLEEVALFPDSRLLPDGRIVLAGGVDDSNYEPLGAVWIFSPNPLPQRVGAGWWILLAAVLLAGIAALWLYRRRKASREAEPEPAAPPSMADRIESLMRDRQFFRRPDLRVADVARELGTNSTYISACLNGETGLSFPDYVAGFRVRYAQELLRNYPDKLLSEVAAESGFASEKSFFRTFKAVTGVTPGEWKEK